MKYIDDFRDAKLARSISQSIHAEADPKRHYKLMEFCGGHTHAIHRYGLPSLLPSNVEMIHGPGCPVCVLPMARIDQAIALAEQPNTILCSYGDMLRVPGADGHSLLKAKAAGADVRMVYSVDDALRLAEQHPEREVIFFAIGFETTTPPTAVALQKASRQRLTNFSVFCNHVLTPPALAAILSQTDPNGAQAVIDGFIGPAHVSIIVGTQAYDFVSKTYHKPIVISGFEPLDLLQSILMLVRQLNESRAEVENEFTRAVSHRGSQGAQKAMAEVLAVRSEFEWRGLGWIPHSALQIKPAYRDFDAEARFTLPVSHAKEHKGCECGAILRGVKKPLDCKLFAKACTPEMPLGSCMVSSEGACAAYYAYGRLGVHSAAH